MAAHEYLQGEQLSMFIPARELMDYTAGDPEHFSGGYLPLSQSPNVRSRKLRESKEYGGWGANPRHQESLYDNIKKRGVSYPVELKMSYKKGEFGRITNSLSPNTQIWDGNHRVVAANDIDPNMEVPVRYS